MKNVYLQENSSLHIERIKYMFLRIQVRILERLKFTFLRIQVCISKDFKLTFLRIQVCILKESSCRFKGIKFEYLNNSYLPHSLYPMEGLVEQST